MISGWMFRCRNFSCVFRRTEEEYGERNYAMEVVFAQKGKDLWDVAKTARVKEEQILAQNPDVVFPTAEDCPLVLFYQRVQ